MNPAINMWHLNCYRFWRQRDDSVHVSFCLNPKTFVETSYHIRKHHTLLLMNPAINMRHLNYYRFWRQRDDSVHVWLCLNPKTFVEEVIASEKHHKLLLMNPAINIWHLKYYRFWRKRDDSVHKSKDICWRSYCIRKHHKLLLAWCLSCYEALRRDDVCHRGTYNNKYFCIEWLKREDFDFLSNWSLRTNINITHLQYVNIVVGCTNHSVKRAKSRRKKLPSVFICF